MEVAEVSRTVKGGGEVEALVLQVGYEGALVVDSPG
jgi:hypothetical protein